jgi:chromosome segregation ATPase
MPSFGRHLAHTSSPSSGHCSTDAGAGAQALELLLKKDEQIKRLEARNRDLQTDVSSLQDSLRSALTKLDAASKAAVELSQSRELLGAQLEREASAAAATQVAHSC